MAKGAGSHAEDTRGSKRPSRSKRSSPTSGTHRIADASDPPEALIHALADALRDILRDERGARAA